MKVASRNKKQRAMSYPHGELGPVLLAPVLFALLLLLRGSRKMMRNLPEPVPGGRGAQTSGGVGEGDEAMIDGATANGSSEASTPPRAAADGAPEWSGGV